SHRPRALQIETRSAFSVLCSLFLVQKISRPEIASMTPLRPSAGDPNSWTPNPSFTTEPSSSPFRGRFRLLLCFTRLGCRDGLSRLHGAFEGRDHDFRIHFLLHCIGNWVLAIAHDR